MGFYDEPENVDEYIKIAEGYDGRELIAILDRYLKAGSSVLELGMGPGIDLDLLAQNYKVTGSDLSSVFIDLYRDKHPNADLLIADAVDFDIDRTFDCIYSNKVLHHLSRVELQRSFTRQREHLNDGGMLMHSFWYGDTEETEQGMRFIYYTEEALLDIVGPGFDVVEIDRYTEMEDDDSLFMLLRAGSESEN